MTVTLSNRDFVTHGDASGSRPLSSDGCPVTFRDRGRLQGDPPQQTVATGGGLALRSGTIGTSRQATGTTWDNAA